MTTPYSCSLLASIAAEFDRQEKACATESCDDDRSLSYRLRNAEHAHVWMRAAAYVREREAEFNKSYDKRE